MNSLPLLALERIVKDVEMRLAGDITLQDGGGHARGEMRVRWFDAAAGGIPRGGSPRIAGMASARSFGRTS